MDFNKSFILKNENLNSDWRLIDASGKVLGRLATEVADILRGKDKPAFTPFMDSIVRIIIRLITLKIRYNTNLSNN